MKKTNFDTLVLITGGAGFIGSHVADVLLRANYRVRVLDNLSEQVHGRSATRPEYLDRDVEFYFGDVSCRDDIKQALRGVDAVVHLAAAVGVGQSMYEISRYMEVNSVGTSILLETLIQHPVEKLLVASSMSIYGEGLYQGDNGKMVTHVSRSLERLRADNWELADERGNRLKPIATPETKPPDLSSVYALSKYDQERLCLMIGKAYDIPVVALRFFNAYGPRQSLSNPYTGVLAIFASRLLNGNRPLIFEDGLQKRDFVSVHDVARACRLALETPEADGKVFNIGSGNEVTVLELAQRLAAIVGKKIEPEITGRYRVGDIRHCFADISLAREILSYEPQVTLESGFKELANWLKSQVAEDRFDKAKKELSARGLTV